MTKYAQHLQQDSQMPNIKCYKPNLHVVNPKILTTLNNVNL